MGEHAQDDITLTHIGAHVFLTPRALQYLFRKYTDLTPMHYLKQMRLHLAHMDLITHEPHQITISAIARKWKFTNAGRFAAHYHQVFGCTPTATLNKRSPETAGKPSDRPILFRQVCETVPQPDS
jgi:transcriptional regulator GlxA family with amidase domain